MFISSLSTFEKIEVKQIEKVYYHSKSVKGKDFDTETGRLKMSIKEHLIYRFEILKLIDEGSFGNVVKVWDHKKGKEYAIKVIKTGESFVKKSKREIDVLSRFKNHDSNHVLLLYGTFTFRNHLCMIMKLYETNLTKFLKKNKNVAVDEIERQIVEGLKYIHSCNIIHGDLKPDNVLIKGSNIVLCDFGLSQFFEPGKKNEYQSIQTLWYRAPEIVLKYDYDKMIDYWSLGCIMYELIHNRVLFRVITEVDLFILMNVYFGAPPNLIELKRFHYLYDSVENPCYVRHNNEIFAFKDDEFKKRNNIPYLNWNPENRISI